MGNESMARAERAAMLCAALAWSAAAAAESTPDIEALIPVESLTASPPEPDSSLEPARKPPIEEIVVTANKREEVLRDIPASIAVLDGESLEQSGAQGIDDFLKLVPGVNIIPNEPGAVKVTIRGISSELGTNSTTGTLFGNVSFNDAYFPFVALDPNPFDMHNVEVLKGPQGTLYGASALNGAVRYVPQSPELDAFEVKYFAQYTQVSEGHGAPIYGAAANLPLGDSLAVRLVGFDRRSPGYIDDTGRGLEDINRIRQRGARVMAQWRPTDALQVSLLYLRQDTGFDDAPFADNRDGRLSRDNTPGPSPRDSYYDMGNLALAYEFDRFTFHAETALVRKRFEEAPELSRLATGEADTSTISSEIFFDSDTWSQELRLSSAADMDHPWRWVAGAFWQEQPIDSGFDIFTTPGVSTLTPIAIPDLSAYGGGLPAGNAFITPGGQAVLGHQRADITVRELALFADVTRDLGDDWQASLGLRGYRTTSGGVTRASGALYGVVENVNDGEVAERGLTPKASLRWQPSDRFQSYVLVSRGFRVGGIQPTASSLSTTAPRSFESDTIWNYEGGVRTQWLDDQLYADLTLFHADWDQPQLAQRDPSNPNPVATYYDNVGGAKSDGAELALQWRTPVDGLSVSVSAAYTRTVTTEAFTTGAGVETTPGTPWPYAPRWQTATVIAYERPLADGWGIHGSLTHTLISEAYTTLANDVPVFDYELVDLQLGVTDGAAIWPSLTLTLSNLTDERGINQSAFTGPANDVVYVRPRAVTLHLGGRF
ncbi:TonB-dependent receptor [Sinimarinibacterium flocculans]|uniref:TonB-dependent receptor n=1 Tax=Sinimarinibacterium flocculans TaxID=985250 RepID=UPI003512326D